MAFGSGKKVEELEAEVERLTGWIAHLQGTEALTLQAEIGAARTELAGLQAEVAAAERAAAQAVFEEHAARAELAHDLDEASMQEAGFYTFNHPLADAVAYKGALVNVQGRMKAMIRAGHAVEGSTTWTVNNSAAQGRKMVKDTSTLMLRAYNAEADSLVRALRPHTLVSTKTRLDKSAMAIERLGKTMSIRIAPGYHRLRFEELELTADYQVRKQQEKEAERDRRAQLRDQAEAAAEMAAALDKLRKEQEHYRNLLGKLDPSTDPDAVAKAQAKLDEIGASISGVEQRAANIRTGHVYVISNVGAFGPNMVKIGMTRRLDPMDRVAELGDASVPFRFDVHAMVFHEDAVSLETHLHQALADRKVNRINARREFFYATPSEVRDIFSRVAGAQLVEYRDTADALEWRASGSITHETQGPASNADAALDALSDATSEAYEPVTAHSDDEQQPATHVDDDISDELDDLGTEDAAPTASPTVETPPEISAPATPAVQQNVPQPIPAQWYVDPNDATQWRFWDGHQWTNNVSPRA
ncbi:MAG TPA: DUF4041 domain-containing protein [Acidothermaceae bacterium]